MIKQSENSILVLGKDGRSAPFEPEELETRIIKCCLSSGSKDVWIAQDISLSVEYALVSQAAEGHSAIRVAELDALVSKILDETGYPDVAEAYRKTVPKDDGALDYSNRSMLLELLSKRTGLSGDALERVAAKVSAALKSMGIAKCSPQLPVELARHFREFQSAGVEEAARIEMPRPPKPGLAPWLAEAKELKEGLSGNAARLVAAEALTLRPLSRLFPSLRLDVSLLAFARSEELESPVNELALVQRLGPLASAIEEICRKADALCSSAGRQDCVPLPLWLFMADASSFASNWLSCEPGAGCGPCQEIADALAEALTRPPFKTTLK